MKFIPVTSESEASEARRGMDAFINGQEPTTPIAEELDDGSRAFEDLVPSDDGLDAKQRTERFRTTQVHRIKTAALRDVKHTTASRLELLRHGVQQQYTAPYYAEAVFITCGM